MIRSFYSQIIIMSVALILLSVSEGWAGNLIILEAAGGIGSPVSPFSHRWEGAVKPGGLYYREFAGKGTYAINSVISIGATFGRLQDYSRGGYGLNWSPDSYPWQEAYREVLYFIPSVRISHPELRLDFGAVLYDEDITGRGYWNEDYPFDGDHRFKPSFGLELGDQGGYIFGRLSNSFPLISGGGVYELGIGGRSGGIYEHKVSFNFSPYYHIGLGYRGEFRVFRQTALSIGFLVGGKNNDNVYVANIGIKTVLER